MEHRTRILWQSLVLTALIFAMGIILNHLFDEVRISTITGVMRQNELDTEGYRVERLFTENFGGEQCEVMTERISDLKKEIRKVGEDLGTYSRFSFFRRKDYDYLKRNYFLLELRFLAQILKLNKECDSPYLPIVFFYKIDDDASERQGFILEDLSRAYDQNLVILSLDKDYADEPLVSVLAHAYNVTTAPTIIIDSVPHTGLIYTGELNASIQKFLSRPDPYAQRIDWTYTTTATGVNMSILLSDLESTAQNQSADPFARADSVLMAGRLTKNSTRICESLALYDSVHAKSHEEQALIYETSAAVGCGRSRSAFLRSAAREWAAVGNKFRANILRAIASGTRVNLEFDHDALLSNSTVISGYYTPLLPNLTVTNASRVIIGSHSITLTKDTILLSQDDRVYRDWLGGQVANPYGPNLLTTFSERRTYTDEELLPEIGWHEGARIKELKSVKLTHIPAVGTLVAKNNERWFAVDDKGVFRFEVPQDKIHYPTTRFLRKDLAVIIDTHGINMLVEQALRYNASAVIGCCDHPGKIYAAQYLSAHNVSVICLPDKYAYLALGHNISLFGSPPIDFINDTAKIGGRPITITTQDHILAVNATNHPYALWYYQTPASYFSALSLAIPLNVTYLTLTDFGQMENATRMARKINASVFATRVFNHADYLTVKQWLDERPTRVVVLFHTAPYPYGQKILNEYPNRATFDDPNPVFE